MTRLASGGLIDRDHRVPFTVDGVTLSGFAGDTLASALLANGRRLVARSFKYHRPRGILSAGSEEPNALFEVGSGDQIAPNTRATTQEIYRGLQARSQNRFPSLSFDLLAANDLFAPFFGAGFYYKTFMWPSAFWEKLYEPLIRRAAGLGALSGAADLGRYDKAFLHCDLLVIGAGPAGLMAARVAGEAGLDVVVADEDFLPGGRLNSETTAVGGKPGHDWAEKTAAALAAMPNVRLMRRTTVTGAYDGGVYGALERVAEHLPAGTTDAPLQTFWRIATRRAILAAGAIERPIAFPDNDRPGIMLAGAVRSYVNRFAVAPGRRVAVFTNNDDGHRTARDLAAAGVEIAALVDSRPGSKPEGDWPHFAGAEVIATKGRLGLQALTVRMGTSRREIEADCLAVSGGWNPSLHLTCHMNGRPVWNPAIAAFVPAANAVPGLLAAGAAAGNFSTRAALAKGAAAAGEVLRELGKRVPRVPLPRAEDAAFDIAPFWQVSGAKGRAWLDFQNDVTTKDIALAHRENYRSVEHMKRYTTLGMATDQGKTANVGALAVMAELSGQSIPQTGTTTFRPPNVPVALGALGAHGKGKGFAPERFIPSHARALERGAPMIEAGLWYRPSWFPREGETHWRQSCDREAHMVRSTVGICDVSTLGKIEVCGTDAAAFLDRVYANMISTLKVGRVRYGIMLHEDGMVLDDGTVARLGRDRFLLTTTTAAAGAVMQHLDFCQQVLWPGMAVRFASVTDQWAQFAVAGPQARTLLDGLVRGDFSNETLTFMAWRDIRIGKAAGRVFRISYSGELGYEIAVPAGYGPALAAELETRALALDGDWYGMEALNVLRIEKGFITHAEIHGRVTAADAGLGAMVSAKKDCVGKAMSRRAALVSEDREQLVGLRPVGAVKQFLGGAHLFNEGDEATRENDQGYVTSHGFSPHLGYPIALAFVRRGRERMGERIVMRDLLRNVDTICEVCDPVFFDPEGGRLRG